MQVFNDLLILAFLITSFSPTHSIEQQQKKTKTLMNKRFWITFIWKDQWTLHTLSLYPPPLPALFLWINLTNTWLQEHCTPTALTEILFTGIDSLSHFLSTHFPSTLSYHQKLSIRIYLTTSALPLKVPKWLRFSFNSQNSSSYYVEHSYKTLILCY